MQAILFFTLSLAASVIDAAESQRVYLSKLSVACTTTSHERPGFHVSVAVQDCYDVQEVPAGLFPTDHELLLVSRAAVDESVYPSMTATAWQEELQEHVENSLNLHQSSTHSHQAQIPLMGKSSSSLIQHLGAIEQVHLYSLHSSIVPQADLFFPPLAELDLLPAYSTSFPTSNDTRLLPYFPVQFNQKIDKIATSLSIKSIKAVTRYLSGEDPSSPLKTRHAFTEDGHKAGKWLQKQYEAAGLDCYPHVFDPASAPNIVCSYPNTNNSSEILLVGAHYDSRGSFGFASWVDFDLCFVADDDGSGSAVLLSIARAIQEQEVQFGRQVMLVAFCSEEQGLRGSRALAREMKQAGKDVVMMIQVDMIAYRDPAESMQIAFPDVIGSTTARHLMGNVSLIYSPELTVGETPVCCSDHQSFVENGFTSTWLFERNGKIVTPVYHNSGDLSSIDGYDFEQVYSIGKTILATILMVGQMLH